MNADRDGARAREADAAQREREDRLRPQVTATAAASAGWEAAAAALHDALPESAYRIWFAPIACIGEVNGALALAAPERQLSWLLSKYRSLLGDAVRAATDYRGAFLFLAPPAAPSDDEGLL